jgi:hypothetical protein
LTEYNKSLNYVHYLKGTLLPHNSIDIAEGPWHNKAYWDAMERARARSAGKQWEYGVQRPAPVREGLATERQEAKTNAYGLQDTNAEITGSRSGTKRDIDTNIHELVELPDNRRIIEIEDSPLKSIETPTEILQPNSNEAEEIR